MGVRLGLDQGVYQDLSSDGHLASRESEVLHALCSRLPHTASAMQGSLSFLPFSFGSFVFLMIVNGNIGHP